MALFRLPQTATAPFCPSEVKGSVAVPAGLPWHRKWLRYAGPGLLVAVGYMDPGNWATDLEAGSRFGYSLLFVVLVSCLVGMLMQTLAARLGLASGRDLAQLCRSEYPRPVAMVLWVLAEISIIACDVAEVLGAALALKLLFGLDLWIGILLTGLDTIIVLGLKGRGFRQLEAITLSLVLCIAVAFAIELYLAPPAASAVLGGLVPSLEPLADPVGLYLAIGIVGATVMPHNLYLHSSIVQTRAVGSGFADRQGAVRMMTMDVIVALALAMFVNMGILILAASAFHDNGLIAADIDDAYRLLEPVAGPAAAILFGLALLAAGQSSTFTGTVAGQVIMEGFIKLKIPCYQRRLITRMLALGPALAGVLWLGDGGVGRLLVISQVVLSLQLPFALYPLITFCRRQGLMGEFASGRTLDLVAWAAFVLIVVANVALLADLFQ